MVREIEHNTAVLSKKAADATIMDLPLAKDLEDTLAANAERCVGMAANMIGTPKRIIVFDDNGAQRTMLNPEIVRHSGEYDAEEGCLSRPGTRKTKRYMFITVSFQDKSFKKQTENFSGFTAQIIQHEIDHCNGILI